LIRSDDKPTTSQRPGAKGNFVVVFETTPLLRNFFLTSTFKNVYSKHVPLLVFGAIAIAVLGILPRGHSKRGFSSASKGTA